MIRLGSSENGSRALSEVVPTVRSRLPWAPLVVWADTAAVHDVFILAEHCRTHGVRGIITGSTPSPYALRRQLTERIRVEHDIVRWVEITTGAAPSEATGVLRKLLRSTRNRGTMRRLAKDIGLSERTVRRQFRTAGLPGPGRWVAFMRLLRAILLLQRNPDLTIAAGAACCGLDYELARRRSRNLIGRPLGEVRRFLGFEPVTYLWLSRAGAAFRLGAR